MSTLTAHKVGRVVNAPKSDDPEEKSSSAPKVVTTKKSSSKREVKASQDNEAKRETKPAGAVPTNRLPDAKVDRKTKKRSRSNTPEPDGQATLDI